MTRALRALGAGCAQRPVTVVAAWLAFALLANLAALLAGGSFAARSSLPGTEVARADARLAAHFPAAADESADLLLHARDPVALRRALPGVEARVRRLPHVAGSPGPVTVATDGRTAMVHVRYDVPRFALASSDAAALARAGRQAGVETHVTGSLALDSYAPRNGLGEKVGIAVAVLVLLVAFGSVVAALLPVATAALAIVTGLGLVRLLAAVYAVNDSAPALATMLGLGAGIDYALFIVTRHRERLAAGADPVTAAAAATASAGSSVLWAGVTVVVAICGLAFAGLPVVTSLGFASAVVVAMSVLAALTLLPALLALAGSRLDRLHVPVPHAHRHDAAPAWTRWARRIERRPVRHLAASVLLLGVLAVPVAGIRLGMPDAGAQPPGTDARRAFDLQAAAFGPGSAEPLQVVVPLPAGPSALTVLRALRAAAERTAGVASVGAAAQSPDRTTAVFPVVAATRPDAPGTSALVERLRTRLHRVAARLGTSAMVTGVPAGRHDVAARVLDRLPWFVTAVLLASFLLLMVVFRSVLVPLKAVLLNLLAMAAALGVVTAVFTWGWLRAAVGLAAPVPVVDVVPMIMFAIVFGLSMDYEVFLLSRIREEWLRGAGGRGSVVSGLASTARVITAAAAIMVCVFCAFTLSRDPVVKMMGLGLAVAVLLDATVIRLVLVPATMALLGDWNWWLPAWLARWLPHVDIDGAVPVTPYAGRGQETELPMARPTR